MNKTELINKVSAKSGLTKTEATKAVDAFVDIVAKALAKGDEVRLVGFGTFAVMMRRATEGRNPRTGEVIRIPASKQPKFKPGKALKDMVNKKAA